jgi:GntR family transcriptional regulator
MAPEPMYQQIADAIQQQIDEGQLERGAQLPTEGELREEFDASRNTIRDALKRLVSLGLVETRPGQGTFVKPNVDPFVTTLSGDPDPEGAEGSVDPESTCASDDDQVVVRHERRFIDGIPWSLMTSFYPMKLVTMGATDLLVADDMTQGTVRYLASSINIRQRSYRDWITARAPDENEQKFFGISHGVTVFELYRTGFDQKGEPLRVTVSVFPVDRNQFIYDTGNPPDPQYG